MNKKLLIQENEALKATNKALFKVNATFRAMLMKVEKYGLPLSKSESQINDKMIREVNRTKKNK